ncbi:MAG: response regulator transcription factor [Oscillospiraceae bacterium]|nr:response regulator transcription factor [Oscillospiraceae bacterium]
MKALIIEDDRILSNNICESIKHMFDMTQAFDGEEGLQATFEDEYDVIILDVMMPKMNGHEVLSQMRQSGNTTPVLMLTALDRPTDQIKGLKAGADDYLSKPFDNDVLQARLEALVRRSKTGMTSRENVLTFLDLSMNLNTRVVKLGKDKLELPGKQFDLLEYLIENKNIIVHKERIFQHIWGFYSTTEFSVVEVYASQIRKVLKAYGYDKYLKTVRGIGYMLTDDSELYG